MLSVLVSQSTEQRISGEVPGLFVWSLTCTSRFCQNSRIWPSDDLCAWRALASLTTREANVLSSRKKRQVKDTCAQNSQKEEKSCLQVWITRLKGDLIPNVHNDLIPFSQSSMHQALRAVLQRKEAKVLLVLLQCSWCSHLKHSRCSIRTP